MFGYVCNNLKICQRPMVQLFTHTNMRSRNKSQHHYVLTVTFRVLVVTMKVTQSADCVLFKHLPKRKVWKLFS